MLKQCVNKWDKGIFQHVYSHALLSCDKANAVVPYVLVINKL